MVRRALESASNPARGLPAPNRAGYPFWPLSATGAARQSQIVPLAANSLRQETDFGALRCAPGPVANPLDCFGQSIAAVSTTKERFGLSARRVSGGVEANLATR